MTTKKAAAKDAPVKKAAKAPAKASGRQKSPKPPPKKRWTLLLDIAADGTLANFGIETLKQLRTSACVAAGGTGLAEVTVAAQFSVDAPAGQKVPRYIFGPGREGESLSDYIVDYLVAPREMTEQQALIDFLHWASQRDDLNKANYYALILWGHGPELLLQPPPAPGHDSISLYLTPVDLRIALKEVMPLPNKKKQFDLIALDACSMSMFEVAYELKDYALYMISSQEEVPDLSFPYDKIVPFFRQHGSHLEKLLKDGVQAYIETYQDYIDDGTTDMKPATLSALRLFHGNALKDALRNLSCALYLANGKPGLAELLIKARESARDFVSGLYVDLLDFASALLNLLDAGTISNRPDPWKDPIRKACIEILAALEQDTPIDKNHLLLANSSVDGTCNGVSLYMPYLSDDELVGLIRPMIKGGDPSRGIKGGDATRGAKDFSSVLNDAGAQQLLCERRYLIEDTEHYYEDLQLSLDTGWYRFIVEQWTRILVTTANKDLELLYSAEQAAYNACRARPVHVKPPCP